jgi:hypothetical protein
MLSNAEFPTAEGAAEGGCAVDVAVDEEDACVGAEAGVWEAWPSEAVCAVAVNFSPDKGMGAWLAFRAEEESKKSVSDGEDCAGSACVCTTGAEAERVAAEASVATTV